MSRWSFLIFGGDAGSPLVKRMAWRLGGMGFILGFAFGFLEPDNGEMAQQSKMILGGLTILTSVVLAYESWNFYQRSDELVRRLLTNSLAIAGGVLIFAAAVYGAMELIFEWPGLAMLHVAFVAMAVSSLAWFIAAWKAT